MNDRDAAIGAAALVVLFVLYVRGVPQRVWSAAVSGEGAPVYQPAAGGTAGGGTSGGGNYAPGVPDPAVSDPGAIVTPGNPADPSTDPPVSTYPWHPVPVTGQDPNFDMVFSQWPAGYDSQWQDFLHCYVASGSIQACRQYILSTAAKG